MKLLVLTLVLAVAASVAANDDKVRDEEDLRLIAVRSVVTHTVITKSTTEVPFTCALAQQTVACPGGKRRKRSFKHISAAESDVDGSFLDSSVVDREDNVDEGDAKLRITVWSASSSTYTHTVTSTNTAKTFSVSLACSLPGYVFPATCG